MQLTRAADYAVRVMIHLAGLPAGTRVTRAALADATGVAEEFMAKVLQDLARARLIVSHRGTQGGFTLAAPPARTSLLEVIEAIEGTIQLNVCLASGRACQRQDWCAAHFVWIEAQQAMLDVLRRATLDRLAVESNERRSAIACAGDAGHRQADAAPSMIRLTQVEPACDYTAPAR